MLSLQGLSHTKNIEYLKDKICLAWKMAIVL